MLKSVVLAKGHLRPKPHANILQTQKSVIVEQLCSSAVQTVCEHDDGDAEICFLVS